MFCNFFQNIKFISLKFQIRSDSLITRIPCNVTTGSNGLSGRFSRRRLRCRFLSLRIFAFCQPGSISLPFRLTETRIFYQKNAAQSTRLLVVGQAGFFGPVFCDWPTGEEGPQLFFIFFMFFSPFLFVTHFARFLFCSLILVDLCRKIFVYCLSAANLAEQQVIHGPLIKPECWRFYIYRLRVAH